MSCQLILDVQWTCAIDSQKNVLLCSFLYNIHNNNELTTCVSIPISLQCLFIFFYFSFEKGNYLKPWSVNGILQIIKICKMMDFHLLDLYFWTFFLFKIRMKLLMSDKRRGKNDSIWLMIYSFDICFKLEWKTNFLFFFKNSLLLDFF